MQLITANVRLITDSLIFLYQMIKWKHQILGGAFMKKYGSLMYGVSDSILKLIAAMALGVATLSVNQCCMWFLGQDEIPENAKKLRRF